MTGNEAENSSGKIQIRREMIYEDPYSKGLPIKDSANHEASITSLEGVLRGQHSTLTKTTVGTDAGMHTVV